jgi:hypothetical protein
MSKTCLKCGKEMKIIENEITLEHDYVCDDCYKLIKKENPELINKDQEDIKKTDENQKDVWHRVAGAYSHIAHIKKGSW